MSNIVSIADGLLATGKTGEISKEELKEMVCRHIDSGAFTADAFAELFFYRKLEALAAEAVAGEVSWKALVVQLDDARLTLLCKNRALHRAVSALLLAKASRVAGGIQ